MERMKPEFIEEIAYFTSTTFVAVDGSSQWSNEALVTKT